MEEAPTPRHCVLLRFHKSLSAGRGGYLWVRYVCSPIPKSTSSAQRGYIRLVWLQTPTLTHQTMDYELNLPSKPELHPGTPPWRSGGGSVSHQTLVPFCNSSFGCGFPLYISSLHRHLCTDYHTMPSSLHFFKTYR